MQKNSNKLRIIEEKYQKLPENFYEIIRRRKLTPCEAFIAIYLRGKAHRFGSPFFTSDQEIVSELGFSRNTIRDVIYKLQTKGVIKYDRGGYHHKRTIYTMLDTVMLVSRTKSGGQHLTPKGVSISPPKGSASHPQYIYKTKKKNKEEKHFIPVDRKQMHKDIKKFLRGHPYTPKAP